MEGTDWTRETLDWTKEKFISKSAVIDEVGLGKSTIHQLEKAGKFPRHIKIGSRSFWLKSQVDAWKRAQVLENKNKPWQEKWINVPRTKGQKRAPE